MTAIPPEVNLQSYDFDLPEAQIARITIANFMNQALDNPAGIALPSEIPQGWVTMNTFPSQGALT